MLIDVYVNVNKKTCSCKPIQFGIEQKSDKEPRGTKTERKQPALLFRYSLCGEALNKGVIPRRKRPGSGKYGVQVGRAYQVTKRPARMAFTTHCTELDQLQPALRHPGICAANANHRLNVPQRDDGALNNRLNLMQKRWGTVFQGLLATHQPRLRKVSNLCVILQNSLHDPGFFGSLRRW